MTEHSARLADLSDAELASRMRDGSPAGEMAELYARHRAALLAYASTCCRDAHTAEDLAAEAFTRTVEAVLVGGGPTGPWRPYLLTVVRRTAMEWTDTARRIELTEDVEQWKDCVPQVGDGEEFALRNEEHGLVVRSFRTLPERWQAVLWHTVVEGETAHRVGAMLGLSASGVSSLAERAREGLREAYLAAHAHGPRVSDECRRYSSLLASAVRRNRRRPERRLAEHLSACRSCRHAFRDLSDLNSRLLAVLPGAVLLWGAEGYTASYGSAAAAATAPAKGPEGSPYEGEDVFLEAGASSGGLSTAAVVGGAAATVAVVTALVAWAVVPDGRDPGRTAPASAQSPARTTASVSASASASASVPASESPSAPVPSRSPLPSPSATGGPGGSASPSAHAMPPAESYASEAAPTGDRTRLRIDSTGMCMGIPQGSDSDGVQPRESTCTGAAWQDWDVVPLEESRKIVLRNAGTGRCLSHSGTTKDGAFVRQASCVPGDPLQVWTMNRRGDGTVAIFTSDRMFLGLKKWAPAARGEPHDSLITTQRHYYASPSLHFRTDP
ncbi:MULTISPECIES: sigma-70 family RNA polymerase sigma factor [unclassified Streptomyces]|uniref:sigma-70 family RNA polymerase sigma factor n=1 Tax=unclassified Streptomyces TaxID=2593676 RepID=UPI003816C86C